MGRYGAIRDRHDPQDWHLAMLGLHTPVLPPTVDYRSMAPPIVDQETLGSCTANAIPHAAVLAYALKGTPVTEYPRSRLWLYWQERWMEHTLAQDAGAMPRDGLRVARKVGIPPETDWPYDPSRFADHPPPDLVAAADCQIKGFYRCQSVLEVKAALVAKHPVVMGFDVFVSFESAAVAQTGGMVMPADGEKLAGGHCVSIDGYADDLKAFIVANSWSADWGDQGYFYMPYDFADPRLGYVSALWAVVV